MTAWERRIDYAEITKSLKASNFSRTQYGIKTICSYAFELIVNSCKDFIFKLMLSTKNKVRKYIFTCVDKVLADLNKQLPYYEVRVMSVFKTWDTNNTPYLEKVRCFK